MWKKYIFADHFYGYFHTAMSHKVQNLGFCSDLDTCFLNYLSVLSEFAEMLRVIVGHAADAT